MKKWRSCWWRGGSFCSSGTPACTHGFFKELEMVLLGPHARKWRYWAAVFFNSAPSRFILARDLQKVSSLLALFYFCCFYLIFLVLDFHFFLEYFCNISINLLSCFYEFYILSAETFQRINNFEELYIRYSLSCISGCSRALLELYFFRHVHLLRYNRHRKLSSSLYFCPLSL